MKGDFLTTAFQRLRLRMGRGGRGDDESEDALQEAFCRLWPRRERLDDAAQAEGMLAVAARNIRIDATALTRRWTPPSGRPSGSATGRYCCFATATAWSLPRLPCGTPSRRRMCA